jgi:hypothetical protein
MADASTIVWSAQNPAAPVNAQGVPAPYMNLVNRVVSGAQAQGAQVLNRSVVGKTVNLGQISYTPRELYELLNLFVQKGFMRTVMLWGPPGLGKSTIVADIARENGIGFIDLRLAQLAPTDIRGIPSVTENGLTRWNPPAHYPRPDGTMPRGILFLDEFNQAGAALQGIAQQLILDRKVGDYVVPDGWFIWAAGNRRSHGASVNAMPTPVANRMVHLEVVLDINEWAIWAKQNLNSPMVLSYVMAYKTSRRSDTAPLMALPDPSNGRTSDLERFPTPRSWQLAAELYEIGAPVAPAIGQDQAESFRAFVDQFRSIYERLVENEPVKVQNAQAANVAWLVVSTGSTSKISVTGNQAEFDKALETAKKVLGS